MENFGYGMPGMPDMLNGPGMQVSGKWYNKRTGKTILVRDSFVDGSGMQIMTSTGEMIDGEEFSRDYIQMSDEVFDESGKTTGQHEEVDYDAMFAGMRESTPEMNYAADALLKQDVQPLQQSVQSQNNPALEKLFNKLTDFPKVNVDIIWDQIPISELNMLKNIFDITDDDIAEYIYNNYCTEAELLNAVAKSIKRML